MLGAGASTVLLGVDSLLGAEETSGVVDSEMRFYAVWYVVAGLALWRGSAKLEEEGWTIRVVAIAFFAAGCARALSWLVRGAPHWSQIVLMVIELALPLLIIPWQSAVLKKRLQPSDAPPDEPSG